MREDRAPKKNGDLPSSPNSNSTVFAFEGRLLWHEKIDYTDEATRRRGCYYIDRRVIRFEPIGKMADAFKFFSEVGCEYRVVLVPADTPMNVWLNEPAVYTILEVLHECKTKGRRDWAMAKNLKLAAEELATLTQEVGLRPCRGSRRTL